MCRCIIRNARVMMIMTFPRFMAVINKGWWPSNLESRPTYPLGKGVDCIFKQIGVIWGEIAHSTLCTLTNLSQNVIHTWQGFRAANHASIRRLSTQTVNPETMFLALAPGQTLLADYLYGNEPRVIILFRVSVSKIENNPSLSRRVHQIVLRAKYITEWKMFHRPNRNNLSENNAKQTMGWDNLILLQHLSPVIKGFTPSSSSNFPGKSISCYAFVEIIKHHVISHSRDARWHFCGF